MVNGPIGRPGRNAVSRAAVEHRADPDPAPIPHHDMEAKTAVEKAKSSVLAMRAPCPSKKKLLSIHL